MSYRRLVVAAGLALASLPATRASAQTTAQNDSAAKAAVRTSGLPLITSRSLKFTTDEASWVSLDVAPDGQTIVFDILGDLYTIPIAGDKATRITSGMGWDQQPRYSPDGSQIVFVSDRNGAKNVWIANADGTKPHIIRPRNKKRLVVIACSRPGVTRVNSAAPAVTAIPTIIQAYTRMIKLRCISSTTSAGCWL